MANLSVENLYALSDAQVKSQVAAVFLSQLEAAPSVHGVFFAQASAPAIAAANGGWVDDVASALVCSSISRSSLYGFGPTVDQGAADSWWKSQLGSAAAIQAGRALYDWAFPAYCQADGASFQDYLANGPAQWAASLATAVTSGSFINTEIAKLLAQDADWLAKLNLVFYKLSRLDGSQVQPVVDAWTKAFPNKSITVQWQSYNFVPANLFQPDQFIGPVNAAISVTTQGTDINGQCATWHGDAVFDFLRTKADGLGLWRVQEPDFVEKGCGACFLAGTPVHLHDGTTAAIENVGKGHKVLAQGGLASEHTAEDVVLRFHHPVDICGINEEEPFFTRGHLFWTQDGWKAVDPAVARMENPDREAGQLLPGDTVYRLKSTQPLEYEEVTIRRLPRRTAGAGTELHGLHLRGEPSYHANGFLVAMNYPQITAGRLKQAFAKMTPHEREFLERHLEPILPMLSKAIGSFIEGPIREALRVSDR